MAIHKGKSDLIERSQLLINKVEVKFCDLVYISRGSNLHSGFEISIESKRMHHILGNVEFVQLYIDGKIMASDWAIVNHDHMRFWRFSEVVSYSPWWPGVEKWAESMQGE